MSIEAIARMDISLLVCLKVLTEELSVTRTAHRLCLSQSSVSKSLARLRELFDDPLFIRHSHGLRPTPKTLFLKPRLDNLISQIESLSEPETFSPARSIHKFNIALVESCYSLILPHFVPALFHQAPSIRLKTHNWDSNTFADLQNGLLDMGIKGRDITQHGYSQPQEIPADIIGTEIYRDIQVCLVRDKHPVLTQEWDLQTYLSMRHIQAACDGNDRWLLDYQLADKGLERDIAMLVPDFNSAVSLCSYTDFIFTVPRHFAQMVTTNNRLRQLPLPTELPPFAYTLFWNKYRENEANISWMKNLIIDHTQNLHVLSPPTD
ncbi:LysR family transcriptional regulator [Vibrio sp. HA2012]|uniref:LysR family transcriptional regulator n=1 Tax=Vibrio sp. HA2012 TaxID=1971595 RepID=UPI000C2CA764|nr:LysR family transcriptional regulator [Vibrio sp. HA2012]PJC84947.1 LysR family transcriptional regulator [Vibrio sp. HA2012]